MSAKYSIVQYVPNPISGERINIGVIVSGDGVVLARFLKNWTRVQHFAGEDIKFLLDFVKDVSAGIDRPSTIPGLPAMWILTDKALNRMIECWGQSIQLTELRGSILSPHVLIEDIAKRFLHEPIAEKRSIRDKHDAVSIVRSPLEDALVLRMGKQSTRLIQKNKMVQGSEDSHYVDVTVGNGHLYVAAQGCSFEVADKRYLFDKLKLIAYSVRDIKQLDRDLPFGVVILPPDRQASRDARSHNKIMEDYNSMRFRLERYGATILSERNAADWAHSSIDRVPRDLVLPETE